MLKHHGKLPFDYGLCADTVTVYHREGLTRQVLAGVHFEATVTEPTEGAVTDREHSVLLVIPYENDLRPGDKVVAGVQNEISAWTEVEGFPVRTVRQGFLQGRFCHTEARG